MSDTPLPRVAGDRYDVPRRRRRRRTIIVKERVSNGEKALLKWILGIVSSLFVLAIIGVWNQAMALAKLQTWAEGIEMRFEDLKKLVEPRYRGQPSDPDQVN